MQRISVIIPTLNEANYIGTLLADLQKQTLQPIEVFIIDANSTDQTIKVASNFDQVSVVNSRSPVGHQRTAGGQKAQGELLVFFDADVHLEPYFLRKLTTYMSEHHLEVAGTRYWPWASTWYIDLFFAVFNFLFWAGQRHYPSAAGPCIAVTKDAFTQLKGFNAELLNDDLEFIRRAAKTYRFGIVPVSTFVSDRRFKKQGFWPTVWQYSRLSWLFMQGKFQVCQKIPYTFGDY